MLLTELGLGQGYLKAGFLGFQAGGKTYTAALLAIGTRTFFKLDGPIAMFDTEGGSEYIAKMIERETGKKLLGVRSQAFADLMTVANECEAAKVSVLIVDSMTHVWRELCDTYLVTVNERRKAKKLPPRSKLEFQDWSPIKKEWARWTTFYLNSPLHIIICGRAGYEYDFDQNEETGAKELIKTGIKMKTEGEFGFEPSLLVEMERIQKEGPNGFQLGHRAKVLKDRFGVLDGKQEDDPTFDFFRPYLEMLTPGVASTINTESRTPLTVDEAGEDDYARLKRRRTIAWERLENGLSMVFPGGTGKDKQARFAIYAELFGTTSETQVQQSAPEKLELAATSIDRLGQLILSGGVPNYAGDLVLLKKTVRGLVEEIQVDAKTAVDGPSPADLLCGDDVTWGQWCEEKANSDETGERFTVVKRGMKLGREQRVKDLPLARRLKFYNAFQGG